MAFPTIAEVEGNTSVLVSGAVQAWPAMAQHFDPIILVDPQARAIVAMCTKHALANLRHEQGPKLIALAGAKGFEPVARTLRGVFGHGRLSRTVLLANVTALELPAPTRKNPKPHGGSRYRGCAQSKNSRHRMTRGIQ